MTYPFDPGPSPQDPATYPSAGLPSPLPALPGYPPGPGPQETGRRQGVEGVGQIFVTALLVILAFTAGWLGNSALNGGTQVPTSARPFAPVIWQAWSTIDSNYVDQKAIDHQKMSYAMIRAMVDSLGDTGHSRFLTPAEVKNLNRELQNASFVGIGVYLQTIQTDHGPATIIEATIPNSPAAGAGLKPGDEIVGVDGKDVTGKTIDELSPLIRGPEGTSVTIAIRRAGVKSDFLLKRAAVTAPLVNPVYFADDQIGYVQITGFNNGTTADLTKKIKVLQSQGMTSLILDLRGNPGGLVDEALGTASNFLPPDTIVVYEKDRSGVLTPDKTRADGLHLTIPMVVLIDNGTASAAEIVSGAINEQRGVTLIGAQTFGTDTVLIPFDLPDGSQVLLGIKQFLSPNKQQLKPGQGIIPTKQVPLAKNAFPINPLVVQETGLTEADVLSCKGITVDAQLQAAIIALKPTRTLNCPVTPAPIATGTPGVGTTPAPGASPTPGAVATVTPKP